MTLSSYFPILIFTGLVVVFGIGSVAASRLLAPRRPTPEKSTPYECGITPVALGGGERFPIRFYVISMLFIVFDVEVVFMYPWAVVFKQLGTAGLVEMGVFVLFLLGAYVYVVKRGGLEWEDV